MSSFPHAHRLVDQIIHSLSPIKLGSTSHSHEILSKLFAGALLVGMYSQLVDFLEVHFGQLFIVPYFEGKVGQYVRIALFTHLDLFGNHLLRLNNGSV